MCSFEGDYCLFYVKISDIFFESLYRAKFACWLQGPSFYWAFILPIGLLLVFNVVVFTILLGKVVFPKRRVGVDFLKSFFNTKFGFKKSEHAIR